MLVAGAFSEKLKNDASVVQLNGEGNLRERHHQNTRMFLFGVGVCNTMVNPRGAWAHRGGQG